MDPRHEKILDYWLKNDLTNALRRARAWVKAEPDAILARLVLAETHLRRGEIENLKIALQAAAEVSASHPMFFRMACLGALAAQAYTASHGAAYCGFVAGLPTQILHDLRLKLDDVCVDLEGRFPTPENPDPFWRNLLPAPQHVRSDPVELVWAPFDDLFAINESPYVDFAVAISVGAPFDFSTRPRMKQYLTWRAGSLDPADIEPWMLQAPAQVYPTMVLHLFGRYPKTIAPNEIGTVGPEGGLITVSGKASAGCFADRMSMIDLITRLCPCVYEGRISLKGPDPKFSSLIPWFFPSTT